MDFTWINTAFMVTGHYGDREKTVSKICESYIQNTGSVVLLY
jgi:hypothetical protein